MPKETHRDRDVRLPLILVNIDDDRIDNGTQNNGACCSNNQQLGTCDKASTEISATHPSRLEPLFLR